MLLVVVFISNVVDLNAKIKDVSNIRLYMNPYVVQEGKTYIINGLLSSIYKTSSSVLAVCYAL